MTAVMAGRPASVAGILISRLGRSTIFHSSMACRIGLVGVVRQPRVDLDRHPAVDAVGGLVLLGQHVAGVADVVGGDRADGGVHVGAALGELGDLRVVGGRPRTAPPGRSTGWW